MKRMAAIILILVLAVAAPSMTFAGCGCGGDGCDSPPGGVGRRSIPIAIECDDCDSNQSTTQATPY